jgi:Peptidase A4 family
MTVRNARTVDTASVSFPGAGLQAGGSGRGGYPMMPGYMMMPGPSGGSSTLGQAGQGTAANAAHAPATTSENWAGYASAGGGGDLHERVGFLGRALGDLRRADDVSSFWVGLDGDGTNSVEQTGTDADCNGGAAAYQGWFEMFPNAPVFYDNPVGPGDAMSASVVAGGGGAFTLTLTDSTRGWTQTTDQTSDTAELGSAEVIAEAPSSGTGTVLPLSDFGTVSFTGVTADNAAIGNDNPSALTMVSASNVTEATPSALAGGNAFTVTWEGNGTGTAPAPAPTATATAPGTGGRPGRHHHHHGFGG